MTIRTKVTATILYTHGEGSEAARKTAIYKKNGYRITESEYPTEKDKGYYLLEKTEIHG